VRSAAAVAVVAILVVASLGAGYLAGTGVRQTETQTETQVVTQTVTSTTAVASTVTSVETSITHTGQPIQAADVEAANISLGYPIGVVVDANAGTLYLLQDAAGRFSLRVIVLSSNIPPADINLPPSFQGTSEGTGCTNLAVDDSTGLVYAIVGGEIIEINASTGAIPGDVPISLGTFASDFTCNLAFDLSAGILWDAAIVQAPGGSEALNGSVIGIGVSTGSVVENVSLGFAPVGVAVDPYTGMVYADGCTEPAAGVCGSQQLAIINGTSGSLVTTVSLYNAFYPSIAVDPSTGIVYVTGGSQLAAVNGTSGNVIFRVYPQTCGPFSQSINVAVIPSLDEVVMIPENLYNSYLLVYNGTTGALVNMYSFATQPIFEGYNASTGELYTLISVSQGYNLLTLHDVQTTGNVNATLIDAGCG
jgi:hypothetical protein